MKCLRCDGYGYTIVIDAEIGSDGLYKFPITSFPRHRKPCHACRGEGHYTYESAVASA